MNTDEYVPASIPIRRTNVKDLMVTPPNMSNDITTANVVNDVFMVRLIVCIIDKLIISFDGLDVTIIRSDSRQIHSMQINISEPKKNVELK